MRAVVIVVLAAGALGGVVGCGSEARPTAVTTTVVVTAPSTSTSESPSGSRMPASFDAAVALGKARRQGDIVIMAEGMGSYGPRSFASGIYRVRFQQFTTDPGDVDFTTEASSLVVQLNRKPGMIDAGTVHVFNATRGGGETQITSAGGQYYVDISSGDYPVVLRFTPTG